VREAIVSVKQPTKDPRLDDGRAMMLVVAEAKDVNDLVITVEAIADITMEDGDINLGEYTESRFGPPHASVEFAAQGILHAKSLTS